MNFNNIEFSIQDHVARLSLNRPDKRNALNAAMLAELLSVFGSVSCHGEVRVLVIRGKGKVFSAGADLAFMSDISQKTDEELRADAALFFDCFERLYRMPIPVICYAHGAVHGGANGLLAASDFVLCNDDTRFSFSEVRLGLVPATVAPFVIRRMGIVKARQFMISGGVMDGTEAHACGLIDHLVRPEDAKGEIEKLIDLIKLNAPEAVSMTKKLMMDIEYRAITAELRELTTDLIARVRQTDEAREGMDAFFKKRFPNWRTLE
jgi:methylglutaconyl-CoA hydratase